MENSMAYSISATDDHCYPGTTVLINKLDIRDQEKLDEAELFIVSVKSLQFEMEPFPEDLDFAYYKRLHQFLFFRQLAERFGYHLDFSAVDSELMMLATIHAASGVLDTLLHVFDQIISKV